jgi:hypothetical protein
VIAANLALVLKHDKGKIWTRNATMELWDFAHGICKHCNAALHSSELEASQRIQDAVINEKIKKLYNEIYCFVVEDQWYFEMNWPYN